MLLVISHECNGVFGAIYMEMIIPTRRLPFRG